MEDGRSSRRRVITCRRISDGEPVHVVLEARDDGYVAAFRARAGEAVLIDSIGVSKLVHALRDLQAIALQGVRWSGIE